MTPLAPQQPMLPHNYTLPTLPPFGGDMIPEQLFQALAGMQSQNSLENFMNGAAQQGPIQNLPLFPSQHQTPPGKDPIRLLNAQSSGIPREWIENKWTPEQIVRGLAVLQEQEKLRGIQGINPREANFFGASRVAGRLDPSGAPLPAATPAAPSPQPAGANLGAFGSWSPEQLAAAAKIMQMDHNAEHPAQLEWEQAGWPQERIGSFLDQRSQLLAGEESIREMRDPQLRAARYPQVPEPSRVPAGGGSIPPNALAELIKERGSAIGANGAMVPRGISTPGVRQMPMGLGDPNGHVLNDPRGTYSTTSPRDEGDILFSEATAVENLKRKRGYTDLEGEPAPGVSAIKTSFGGEGNNWIQNSGAYRPSAEEIAANNAATKRINSNLAHTRDRDGDGRPDYLAALQQRTLRRNLRRHNPQGADQLDMIEQLQALGGGDYTDPALAAAYPQIAEQQRRNQQTTNDNRDSLARANRFGAEADAIRSGVANRTPDAPPGRSVYFKDDPVFGAMPDEQRYRAFEDVKANTIDDFVKQVPSNAVSDEKTHNYLRKRFGEESYTKWKNYQERKTSDAEKVKQRPFRGAPPRMSPMQL